MPRIDNTLIGCGTVGCWTPAIGERAGRMDVRVTYDRGSQLLAGV